MKQITPNVYQLSGIGGAGVWGASVFLVVGDDHVGRLAELKKITRARVMAHPADAPYIDGRLPQPGPTRPRRLGTILAPLYRLWTTTPVALDRLVNDGDELPALGGIKVLHTPGHTPGSISLLLQKDRLVIAGDVLAHRFRL